MLKTKFSQAMQMIIIAGMLTLATASLPAQAQTPLSVTIDGTATRPAVSAYEYGMFIEPIGQLVARSFWAEMLDDRKFYFPFADDKAEAAPTDGDRPFATLRAWRPVGEAASVSLDTGQAYVGKHSVLVHLQPASWQGLSQTGIGIADTKSYVGHIVVKAPAGTRFRVALVWGEHATDRQNVTMVSDGRGWQTLPFTMVAGADSLDARFEVTAEGTGDARIGTVSLMPSDNIDGWRADTTAIARSLHSGFWRMPGGNFLSDWDWHGALGPRDLRAPMYDHAWNAMQTNDIGIDEWLKLADLVGAEPYLTVNAGLGDANSAAEEVEYVNGGTNTEWGAKRAANGHPQPYGVKFWNIGNEPYGAWQIGVTQLKYYVIKHTDFADAMLKADPTITLIASGAMPDQGKGHGEKINMTPGIAETRYNSDEDWTGGLLAGAPGTFQGISEHWYDNGETRPDASAGDELLEFVRSPSNHVRMKAIEWEHYRSAYPVIDQDKIFLSIDEYAYINRNGANNTLKTALAYSMIFQEMLRHTDFLTMAAHTSGASTMDISPTHAELNTTGLVFKLYGEHFGKGTVPLAVEGNSPQPDPKYVVGFNHPQVNAGSPTWPLDIFAALGPDRTTVRIGIVNPTFSSQPMALSLAGLKTIGEGKRWVMTGKSLDATNRLGAEDGVVVTTDDAPPFDGNVVVPAISTVVLEYQVAAVPDP